MTEAGSREGGTLLRPEVVGVVSATLAGAAGAAAAGGAGLALGAIWTLGGTGFSASGAGSGVGMGALWSGSTCSAGAPLSLGHRLRSGAWRTGSSCSGETLLGHRLRSGAWQTGSSFFFGPPLLLLLGNRQASKGPIIITLCHYCYVFLFGNRRATVANVVR